MEQRRLAAAESLLAHSLFGFQVHDTAVSERLRDLRELLLATCGERDQIALLSESIREIEEQLQRHSERYLLEPLRRFEQEMELLLDVGSGDEAPQDEEEDDQLTDEDQECWSQEGGSRITPCPSPQAISSPKQEEEVLCGVCCAPDSLENDPIVICDVCGVAVHQTCYRLATVPDGDWYCHPCRQYLDAQDIEKNLIPTHELECEACCAKAGAMSPTVDGKWVHVACSMFLPELYVQDKHAARFQGSLDDVQVVCGVDKLRPRRKLRCCFCKKTNEKGACAQCAVGKCTVAYHALCALRNGIKLRYMEDRSQFGSGCLKHQAKFLTMGGESESEVAVHGSSKSTAENLTTKRSHKKKSWSDEDDSESDEASEDENELDSDSDHDGSEDSVSDGDQHRVKSQAQPTPTKQSPPRLLGGPPMRRNRTGKNRTGQTNKPRRNRQIELSFTSADDTTVKTDSPTKLAPGTVSINPVQVTPSTAPQQLETSNYKNDITNSRVILQANTFAPVVYPPMYKPEEPGEHEFEYVMVLITSRPLGLGVTSSTNGPGIFLFARSTTNPAVVEAINRAVIHNGDEIFAFNDQVLRNTDIKSFKDKVVPALQLPIRCWFRTKRKSTVFTADLKEGVHILAQSATAKAANTPVPGKQHTIPATSPSGSVSLDAYNSSTARSSQNTCEGDSGVVSLGIDWPWVFLRSDGKLAMNLFWKSLDSAFFIRKINKRTFSLLQSKVEDMCGVRLSSNHPEYELVRELLVMPRRERIPVYLVEFRNSRKQKHTFLSSDILMGVSSESKGADAEVEEKTPLDVGTTVTVAKRTWPGMNKLGGVGRIKKVNEKTLPDGAKRFTYNVVYVMGGKENNVERKWISVVDLDTEEPDKTGEPTGRRQKSEPEPDVKEAADEGAFNIRLSYVVHRGTDEEKLAALPDAQISSSPKRRKFQLQFSTANATVFCERKGNSDEAGYHNDPNVAPAKELLLHRHFDVKLPEIDALTNACFSSELTSLEDRVGDEVDEDDTDSEGEADEIKTELATLQSQFRTVMEANEQALTSLTKKVEEEYAAKGYRQQELQDIQWRNYERMYQELQAAKRQFDDSDGESNEDGDIQVTRSTAGKRKNGDRDGEEDSEDEDISFGGMFVNKLKQEGSEVCALCELSGGDFTGTDNGTVVHPQCAMFTPETFFKDGVVHGIQLVDPERRQLKCSICGGRKGMSKVQCANRKCVQAFHVACAFVNGLLTKDPYYQAWCPRHLKTSGMGQFVELPGHLHKQDDVAANVSDTPSATPASSPARRNRKSSKQRRSRKKNSRRQETTPGEASTAPRAAISSSKTNKKRRRKDSNAGVSTIASSAKSARGNRGGSPRSAIAIEDLEPRCVRRLEIDELSGDSDHEGKAVEAWQQGRDTNHVFLKNDVVEVLGREWRGINKPGGVARVRGVEMVPNQNGEKDVFYDVNYVLGTYKEKHVAARFIRSYDQSSAE
ncbi:hypothetical protein PRIC1_008409 [Phytophthora ramorum]